MSKTEQNIPPIFHDSVYRACISLAKQSKGPNERYGSVLLVDHQTIGKGFNRSIAHSSFGTLPRILRQGYANHAEVEAINDALSQGRVGVSGAILYVAGYFPKKNGQLYFKTDYTCIKCPPIITQHGISTICVPMPEGWIQIDTQSAITQAKKYLHDHAHSIHDKRVTSAIGLYSLTLLEMFVNNSI